MYAVWVEALKAFFGRARHANAPVPVVFARPDRAFEELARIMKRRRDGAAREGQMAAPATQQASTDRPAAVPFMSVWMQHPKFYAPFHNPARVVVARDRASGTAQVMRMPRPMAADLQVELMTETSLDAWDITSQLELQFQAESVLLPIDWTDARWYKPPFNILEHARVLGRTTLKVTGDGWTDNSGLEEGEAAKLCRLTFSGKLYGVIPYRPDDARLLRTLNVELADNTTDPPTVIAAEDIGAED